jgi:hypothetical protein
MLYKFRTKDAADVIMTGPAGDHLLKLIGRPPSTQGIFESAHLSSLMAALEQAIRDDEAAQAQARAEAEVEGQTLPPREGVSLKQRAWPLLEMMRLAAGRQHDIVWGV